MSNCLVCSKYVETNNYLTVRGVCMPVCKAHLEEYNRNLSNYEVQALADVVAEQAKKEKES